MYILLLAWLLFGHIALWVAWFNRAHAWPIPRQLIRFVELALIMLAVGGVVWMLHQTWLQPDWLAAVVIPATESSWLRGYVLACCLFAAWVSGNWLYRAGWTTPSAQLVSNHTDWVDVAAHLGAMPLRGWSMRLFACLPANQMFNLAIHTKTIELPRLPRGLDGLSILHLSDLHFTGKVTRPFHDYVVARSNELDADLVAITGDILEDESCFPWLAGTLGQLRSRRGVYFVLGNHDNRLRDVARLRRELTDLGLHDLGQAPRTLRQGADTVLLAGNELPWFGPPPSWPTGTDGQHSLRILLAHTPDQITWARRHDFDLALAGHTHGGHIRLPVIGPMVCPSRFGIKYAGGLFHEPPTTMHVSRGISGLDPLRFNCPPELTKLVLRCGAAAVVSRSHTAT